MGITELLANDNYIVVNKDLIKIFGLEEAVLIGELCSEYSYWKKENRLIDDMFYSTADNIEYNTGLTAYQQRKAFQSLEDKGIISTKLKGIPATKHFKLNEEQLLSYLTSSCEKTLQLDVKKIAINNNKNNNKKEKVLSKDNTTEFLGSATKKPKKETMYSKCVALINDFTDDVILQNMLEKCLQMFLTNSRESGMPFYTNHFKGKLNKLKSLSDDNYVQRDIVKQTIDNGWNNFYELKENKNSVHNRLNESGAEKVPTVNKKSRKENIANGKAEKF